MVLLQLEVEPPAAAVAALTFRLCSGSVLLTTPAVQDALFYATAVLAKIRKLDVTPPDSQLNTVFFTAKNHSFLQIL